MRRSRPSSAQIRSPPLFEFTPPLTLSPAEQPFRQTRLGGSWVTESETEVWSKAWSDASASRLPRPASAAPRCANNPSAFTRAMQREREKIHLAHSKSASHVGRASLRAAAAEPALPASAQHWRQHSRPTSAGGARTTPRRVVAMQHSAAPLGGGAPPVPLRPASPPPRR